ncbi:hypothetical protein [Chroococcidiopsis sp. CCMEE 29]|uniref:hypothetical protein n=1 Tax=Chroococcidiopsis sp. CCMEE 29 TaxID=155894 RepID=UPI00201FDAEC|nr:hypothetical protein [Chroococcidiopsis sp. CCMEE 29]
METTQPIDNGNASSGNDNNITGSGNWEFRDGQWQSSDGRPIGDQPSFGGGSLPSGDDNASAGENPFAGNSDTSGGGGNPFAGGSASGFGGGIFGDPLAPAEGYEYDFDSSGLPMRTPFDPLFELPGIDGFEDLFGGDGSGNPFAGGDASASDSTDSSGSGNVPGNLPFSGGNNPFAAGGSTPSGDGSSASDGSDIPGNLPFGNTPPSLETGSDLPETGTNGLPVPYGSDNWISDIQNLDGANATGNTANGNGNWNFGSDNTTNGNGNWNFGSDNTTDGNGNWSYGSDSTTSGNGNWNFGSDNTIDGNGNWQLGNENDILGNANRPTGDRNDILGSGNTSDVSGSTFVGNRIEGSSDDQTFVGNEGWAFPLGGDTTSNLTSLGSSTPSQAIGFDISSSVGGLLSSPDLTASATANPGYDNPNYTFNFGA